jgi:hypothetical protein
MAGSGTYGAVLGSLLIVISNLGLAADSEIVSRTEYDSWRAGISN